MKRKLALTGLLLSAPLLLADPIPTQPGSAPQPPQLGTGRTIPAGKTVSDGFGQPTPAPLLHPSNGSSLLPARPGTAPAVLAPDVLSLQQETERLRAEREALAAAAHMKSSPAQPDTTVEDAAEAARLRGCLAGLLAELEAKRVKEASRPTEPTGPILPVAPPQQEVVQMPAPAVVQPPDPLLIAQLQYRGGQYESALETLRKCVLEKLSKEDRALVLYLSAGCWRQLDKLDEACSLYFTVAKSHDDEALVEAANWHLHAIETRRGILRELTELRASSQLR